MGAHDRRDGAVEASLPRILQSQQPHLELAYRVGVASGGAGGQIGRISHEVAELLEPLSGLPGWSTQLEASSSQDMELLATVADCCGLRIRLSLIHI